MLKKDAAHLSRPIHPMPAFVKEALLKNELMDAYHNRPPYQQNDYIGWITRAKQDETRQKRLKTMLNELAKGNGYMGLEYTVRK